MGRIFQLDSPLIRFLTRAADLIILNVLFLIFSLPVFTLGASLTAMYRVCLNFYEDKGSSVARMFWEAFRENFKKATLVFLILLPPTALAVYETAVALSGALGTPWLLAVFVLPLILVVFVQSYVYPLSAQFENSIWRTIKNALLLSVGNLPRSILIGALNLLPFVLFLLLPVQFLQSSIVWIFAGFSLTAYLNTWFFRRIFKKVIQLTAAANGDSEEASE